MFTGKENHAMKFFSKMNLRTKFILMNVSIVAVALACVTVVCLMEFQIEMRRQMTTDQENRIKIFRELLHQKGSELRVADGHLMAGSYKINDNFELPDKVKELCGGAATIFMGDVRVSTNVLKSDGTRAVGTRLEGPAYDAVFKEGKPYRGEAQILGVPYFTTYEPIRDGRGEIIGALFVGVQKSEFFAVLEKMKFVVVGLTLFISVLASLCSGLFVRYLFKPLTRVLELMKRLAGGDLTVRCEIRSQDELGKLAGEINAMADNLQKTLEQVVQCSTQVAAAAGQLNSTSVQMATGAEEVAAQTGTVATAGEEMAMTSTEISHNCATAAQGAMQANDRALAGATVVEGTVAVMNRIAAQVRATAKTVEGLGERGDQIGEIIGTIEDIADQTNLLALNAAIEAARAGEQGRGFAVVADEVRALAERTTRATREIGEMIKAIQSETRGAVTAMDQGVKEVEKGTGEAARSGEALQEILDQINSVVAQVNQIAVAAEQQTAITGEISNNIHQITEVVQGSAKGAQESAAAASQLSGLAEEMQRLVGEFKLTA
jgi:methyl-accepting chemotaxis protein